MSLHLVLPLPPNRANARGHWRKIHTQKSAYFQAAQVRVWQQADAVQRCSLRDQPVTITAKLYVWSKFDDDNATALLKWPLDVLKMMRIIRDDKRPHCALSGIPEQFVDRKSQRVELWLEPAA